MELTLSFFLPFAWIYYFYKKDCHPEPILWLFFAFFLGIISAFIGFYSENFIISLGLERYSYLYQFLAALIEEFFKFFLILVFIFPKKTVDEPIDFMIYLFFSAFGFAFIENLGFFLKSEKDFFYFIAFLRFLGANFLHILASGLVGYGSALSYQTRRLWPLILSLLSASFLHFIFNSVIINYRSGFLLVLPLLWSIFFIVLVELKYLKLDHGRRES